MTDEKSFLYKLGLRIVMMTGQSVVTAPACSQTLHADSIHRETSLTEVTVTSTVGASSKVPGKGRSASIEEHLLQLPGVDMVRRGTYAWEPVVNGMTTERLSTTIDGMKIFYACTDKMDPVTSYVESGNLQRIRLDAGLDGNPQATGNIGGSIDLKLRKAGFEATPRQFNVAVGYEANGRLQTYGADAALSSFRCYTNLGAFYRHADNYRAGDGSQVQFSQFQKVNTFWNGGWRPADGHIVEATLILDRATDVGYPALNMDVSDATALITSLSYRREHLSPLFHSWETKAYYNHITHNMDDTQRPDVTIHMDMPGRSSTAGIYSLLQGSRTTHHYQLNYDAYYNTLFADMTMYVTGIKPMYMLTWPDVATLNQGLALADDIQLGSHHHLRIAAKGSWQQRRIRSDQGFRALTIYFPDIQPSATTLSGHITLSYAYHHRHLRLAAGAACGSRTPTVTEAYGYFLNNTLDRYDYIGNPRLHNESAVELNASAAWTAETLQARLEANTFLFTDYIIGTPDSRLTPMTIGAKGVKVYRNLHDAQVVNLTALANWQLLPCLGWHNRLAYSYGRESNGQPLPMIAPLTYQGTLKLAWRRYEAQCGVRTAAPTSRYADSYGETPTAGYAVCHLSLGVHLQFRTLAADLHIGAENLLDRHYTTYADWNHIPQKGRNIYLNAAFQL